MENDMAGLYQNLSKTWCRISQSSFVKNHIAKSRLFLMLTDWSKNYTCEHYAKMSPECYEEELKKWFKKVTGKECNLEEPKTYNEKLQWLKLHDSTKEKALLSDKYAVREWVKEKIGEEYLIPLLGVYDSFDEIDFDKLPNQFVLKANHGSGWNIIVKDKATFDKRTAKKKFDRWMKMDFSFYFGFQLHYQYIDRKIVAEKYLENNGELDDYKVMCFGGKAEYIWIDLGRYEEHRRNIYDVNWKLVDMQMVYPNETKDVPPPVNLHKMIKFAELMSQGFPHVRVDFYEVNKKLYFGEMTFTSTSGTKPFTPDSWDRKLGDMIELPKNGIKNDKMD